MSDPKWPNEPFKAVHDASGTPVKVTPIDYCEDPDLLPQSMRVGKGEPRELHWVDMDSRRLATLRSRMAELGISITGSVEVSLSWGLLCMIDDLHARLAKLENPQPPEGT